jgi:hypothetical protein
MSHFDLKIHSYLRSHYLKYRLYQQYQLRLEGLNYLVVQLSLEDLEDLAGLKIHSFQQYLKCH